MTKEPTTEELIETKHELLSQIDELGDSTPDAVLADFQAVCKELHKRECSRGQSGCCGACQEG